MKSLRVVLIDLYFSRCTEGIFGSIGHDECTYFRILGTIDEGLSAVAVFAGLAYALPSFPSMQRTGIDFDFPLRFRSMYRHFRLPPATTMTMMTMTTTATMSPRCVLPRFVAGPSCSHATISIKCSPYSGIDPNAPSLISVFRFFFTQPAKMVWINNHDVGQVLPLVVIDYFL